MLRHHLLPARPPAALLVALLVCGVPAGAQEEPARPLFDDPTIESVRLGELRGDSVTLTVTASVVSRRDVTFESLEFERLAVEGIELAVPLLPGPLQLRTGETLRLPAFTATVGFDGLPSLDALRAVLVSGAARVEGSIRGRVAFTFWQRLATLKSGAWVVLPFQGQVQLAGDASVEQLALGAALSAAGGLFTAGRVMREALGLGATGAEQPTRAPGLVVVVTTYTTRARDGTVTSRDHTAAGIRLDEATVIAPAEAAEPWRFDAALAEQLGSGAQRVERHSVITEIHQPQALAGSTTGPAPLRPASRRVEGRTAHGISPVTRRLFPLRLRDRDDNVAVFRLAPGHAAPHDAPPLRTTPPPASDEWQPSTIATVVRGAEGVRIETRQVPVRWNGRRYELRYAASPASFGSPIWSADGALLGMVQDGTSGAGIDALLGEAGLEEVRLLRAAGVPAGDARRPSGVSSRTPAAGN